MSELLFSDVVRASQAVQATRSRKAKIAVLAPLIAAAAPHDIGPVVAFLSGAMRQGKIGIGYRALTALRADLAAPDGDAPTLQEVDRTFAEVQAVSGKGAVARRADLMRGMLRRLDDAGRSFLCRLVVGELRQGALEAVVVDAVAHAFAVPATRVRRATMLSGDLSQVAERLGMQGAASLNVYKLVVMRAVQPMLAHTAEDVNTALAKLSSPIWEYKLDGARVQVHKQGDEVRVFSRNLNDVTQSVPEVVEAARGYAAETLILDGETLAMRPDGRPHPFQVTMRRYGRSLNVDAMRAELPLSVRFFDCLHADGDLIDAPATERFDEMHARLPGPDVIPRLASDDESAASAFYDAALAAGHEGVVVKAGRSTYEAGKRGASWLKVKRVHTLDLVVLAADWGSGRRKGYLSNLHLGARDAQSGTFLMLGKTFKGMTDTVLKWQTKALLERATEQTEWTVHVRPELVVEVAFDGLQESPHYPGGLALRFARIRGYRSDKPAAAADTFATAQALYGASVR